MNGKKEIDVILRFVDAMVYSPDCTFDQFMQDYTEKKVVERVKDSVLMKLLLQIIKKNI
jgi:predicted nucleic acid-binding protein